MADPTKYTRLQRWYAFWYRMFYVGFFIVGIGGYFENLAVAIFGFITNLISFFAIAYISLIRHQAVYTGWCGLIWLGHGLRGKKAIKYALLFDLCPMLALLIFLIVAWFSGFKS